MYGIQRLVHIGCQASTLACTYTQPETRQRSGDPVAIFRNERLPAWLGARKLSGCSIVHLRCAWQYGVHRARWLPTEM